MKNIPLSIPNFCGNEKKYTDEAIESAWVSTGGPFITKFENAIKAYVNVADAVAVSSGTAAIHLALISLNIGQGDLVIVPTLSFIASANPIKYVNAEPLFMDCDDSLCMDPVKLEQFLDNECVMENDQCVFKANSKPVKAVIIVDVFGNAADKEALIKVAHKHNLKVVEDSCESIGTRCEYGEFKGKFMGTLGDIGTYSFNGNKIVTTGGGGMIVSNNVELAERCRYLSTQAKDDLVYFYHGAIGYNYRMTNIQASVGLAQLELLEDFIAIKIKNYDRYHKLIEEKTPYKLLDFRKDTRSNHWFYSLIVRDAKERDEMIAFLKEHGVQSRPIWYLIHKQKPYKGSYSYKIEKAEYYWDKIVNIPCSTNLTFDEIDEVVNLIAEFASARK